MHEFNRIGPSSAPPPVLPRPSVSAPPTASPLPHFRYILLLIAVLCLTSICSNMIAFNFTLILMRHPNWNKIITSIAQNGTNPVVNGGGGALENDWIRLNATHALPSSVAYSPEEKSSLLYSIGIASILSTFPFSALYTAYGARFVFLAAGAMSAVATALLPLAASHGMATFLVVRIFQGFAYGANYSVIGLICHRWANLHEHGFFLACMTSFTSIATTLTNLLAGFISSTPFLGWPWVYYVLALFSILPFGLWFIFYSDNPESHRWVGAEEREHILRDKSETEIGNSNRRFEETPYWDIFTDRVVLVIWLNAFAHMVTVVFLITYLPTYISKVLGFGVRETGILSSVPTMIQIPLRIGLGWLADTMKQNFKINQFENKFKLSLLQFYLFFPFLLFINTNYLFFAFRCMNELNRMRLYNTIALADSGVLFGFTGFVPDNMPLLAVILITLNLCATSFDSGGLYKCATLISRQYSHYVIAGIQIEKSITMILSPIVFLLFITDESSRSQWRILFLGMAFLLIIILAKLEHSKV